MNDSEREKLELLDGSRRKGGARDRAAVRLADLAPLLELPPSLKSRKSAGSTPTRAEYDALRQDVEAVHARLTAVVALLQARLLP